MKKIHIFIIVLCAVAFSVIISAFGDFSTYETFASASEKPGTVIHVVGYLDTNQAQEYDPLRDANKFTFFATDKKGETTQVVFNGSRPQDFEKSEQLVLKGFMKDGIFHCQQIQMKCPSKYENDQIVTADDALTQN